MRADRPSECQLPSCLLWHRHRNMHSFITRVQITGIICELYRAYCDIITWSAASRRLGKHVSATTDTHGRIKDIVGNGAFNAVCAEAI
jgi:hypothetical protein